MQNVQQHNFPEPCGGRGQIGPQRWWKWQHFVNLMKMIDSSLPSVTHIWVTLSNFFPHFTLKGYKEWLLREMPEVIIKPDKMLKD
jgi:hypothetical protein